ncbi:hypothetical protein BT93_L0434 [Corymbia citriodora subsp. variegata]|uniref:Uncharacterized protein n=1 Tax=Corymbia citriodora subsp. variegata TaxID=360336 RepID=A0A8T0CPQ9_CORYI|nr:hypothetical protein BT93_L0434 [Corymbia citriodora subsp. variegata]
MTSLDRKVIVVTRLLRVTHKSLFIFTHLRTANVLHFYDFLYFHNFNYSKSSRVSRNNYLVIHDLI